VKHCQRQRQRQRQPAASTVRTVRVLVRSATACAHTTTEHKSRRRCNSSDTPSSWREDVQGSPYGAMGLAKEVAADEIAHVRVLRGALGEAAVPCPLIDISAKGAWRTGATATFGKPTKFDPYASDLAFLIGAFVFEDVGVTAYNGAAYAVSRLLPYGAQMSRVLRCAGPS
jgi:Ferritin-like domain